MYYKKAERPGISLLNLNVGDRFRTILTDRVGVLREKGQYALRVTWADLRGPNHVHREMVVEPWPRALDSPRG